MDTIECIMTRKSTKAFADRMPAKQDLQTILDAGRRAPSGMNKQTWQFTCVTNKDWLARVNAKLRDHLSRPSDYVCYYGAPVLIVVSADSDIHTSEADCACAIENMYLAAHALNLGACWINQLGKANSAVIRPELTEARIPANHIVYGCIAIGYAPADYQKPERTLAENRVVFFE